MTMKHVDYDSISLIFFLSIIWLMIRLFSFDSPLVDKQYWRQTDTASIAKNYYQDGMNLFYPQVNWRGSTEGYVESEFQAYTYIVAYFYKLFNKADEKIGRLVSIIFSLFYGLTFYGFIKKLFDSKTAILSFFLLMVLPISVYYSRTFMPESMMLFFYLNAFVYFYHWIQSQKTTDYVFSLISLIIALLIKPTTIFISIPMFYLSFLKFGKMTFKKKSLYMYCVIALLPSFIWYTHAGGLYQQTNLSFGILSGNTYSKFLSAELLLSFKFWEKILNNIFTVIFTPFGGVLFLMSILVSFFDQKILNNHVFIKYWILSVFFFIIIIAEGNYTLEYYQLFMIFPGALFIARFIFYLFEVFLEHSKKMAVSFFIMVHIFIVFNSFGFVAKRLKPVDYTLKSYQFSKKIENSSNRKNLFIVIDTPTFYPKDWFDQMKHRIRRPSLLYFLNRNGWVFLPHEFINLKEEDFSELIKDGAKFFVLPKEIMRSYSYINEFINLNQLKLVQDDDHFCLYDLSAH